MTRLFFFSLVFIASVLAAPASSFAQHRATNYKMLGIEILKLINDHRAGIGKPPMKMDELISSTAARHSQAMGAKKRPFGHDGFDARVSFLKRQIPSSSWAENVAYGSDDPKEIVEMWLSSEGHRKNIEGDYNITGIGVAPGSNGTYYYTQIFLKQDGEIKKRGLR